jgi:hypothetical protein
MYEMVKTLVSFIHLFMILMKNVDFRVLALSVLDRTVGFSVLP